ncbi:daunorubicin resistance protein DrrA family ABC transporter ATP-binding protein [Actinomadura oligospora]|uniref:daunorubicin resistance protein DrrA family ABC transporter ATP-binding protein n=1 Tax=Actinomadura oligospora TaxID=111804 RepID=UPI000479571C|nr:daunorubicin resistance protein DrrA family ABC transporter ATP-binding protein [Actinomadura oligospora]
MSDAITAEGLVKRYGEVKALDGLSFSVPQGTVLAVLGPNGAGKTTTVRVLTTLLRPDEGRAVVAGYDVVDDAMRLRAHIGLSGQYAAVDEHLTGAENLEMVGRLYHLGAKRSKARARELLERFDLVEAGDRPVKGYSGGMRRRIDLAGALVADPPVLFMDEPTTGLDPRARNALWNTIAELVAGGTTLLLTTQYMDEAERLADDVLVVDHGRAIARGTTDALKDQVGGNRVEVSVTEPGELDTAREALAWFAVGAMQTDPESLRLTVPVTDGAEALRQILGRLADTGVRVRDAGLRRPTLDDVYLTLTGRQASGADTKAEEAAR